MLGDLLSWATRWGDVASIAGVLLTVVGFTFTIYGVYRSKNAAQSARVAAAQTLSFLTRHDMIADFAAALAIMDEIKRLHRTKAWAILPDRYTALRQKLVAIRSANPQLAEEERIVIHKAAEEFRDIERRVERALSIDASPPNPAKLNEIVGAQIDALSELLTRLKQQMRD